MRLQSRTLRSPDDLGIRIVNTAPQEQVFTVLNVYLKLILSITVSDTDVLLYTATIYTKKHTVSVVVLYECTSNIICIMLLYIIVFAADFDTDCN